MSTTTAPFHRVDATLNRKSLFRLAGPGSLFVWLILATMVYGGFSQSLCAEEGKEAEETKEAAEFYKFYTFYHGKWQIEEETAGKKKTLAGECFGSSGGCNLYVGKGETSIWGYDPKTRQWTGVGQLDDGSRFVVAISRPPGPKFIPGMTFTFTGTIWHSDDSVHYVTNKSTCVDENTIHEVITGTDQDGKAIPKVTKRLKRIK